MCCLFLEQPSEVGEEKLQIERGDDQTDGRGGEKTSEESAVKRVRQVRAGQGRKRMG